MRDAVTYAKNLLLAETFSHKEGRETIEGLLAYIYNEHTTIMQPWTTKLGLRHQGVLVAAVRGCDGIEREDTAKWLNRFYRSCVLKAHVGDPRKATSFMVWPQNAEEFWRYANQVIKSHDHYPMHYVLHLVHAAEILGYYHPDAEIAGWWRDFYYLMVRKMHLRVETREELDKRLGADEASFGLEQNIHGQPCV